MSLIRFGIALCVLTLSRFAWGHVAVTGAPPVACTHEMTGNDFTQLTLGQTPCPSSPAAAAPTVPDPIELYAISYRDEANDQMYSGGYEGITVPPAPPYSTNQAFRWVLRLFGNALKTGGENLTFEASVGYGHWPLVNGTVDGEYSVWTALGRRRPMVLHHPCARFPRGQPVPRHRDDRGDSVVRGADRPRAGTL